MSYAPARVPTMYFIGVTTGLSSIMKVFPAWAKELGIDAIIKGIDFVPDDKPHRYREAVEFNKSDSRSLGALVTTHKVNLLKASRDLFDYLDDYARTLDEISSISKREGALRGHAKDPITVGYSLEAIVEGGYWRSSGAEMLILGSGGSALALTLYLHNNKRRGGDAPAKIVVTARTANRLDGMKRIHQRIGFDLAIDYAHTPAAADADRLAAALPPGSMVINATGLGKDRPGSPCTDAVRFPDRGIVWEFNYRGDLRFLRQAEAQKASRDLKIEDGWVYFVHGWTRVIAEVFDVDIARQGRQFERMSEIAREVSGRS
jgi:shikimate 5-dehydrogenase